LIGEREIYKCESKYRGSEGVSEMLLGVFSDTHDHLDNTKKAIELFNRKKVDLVIHGGDLVSPFTLDLFSQLQAPWKGVFGNNEGEIPFILEKAGDRIRRAPLTLELEGMKVLVKHFHHYVEELAVSGKYHLIIYGHTHKVRVEKIGSAWVLNPGEACGWLTGKATVALVEIPSLQIEIEGL